MSEFVRDSVGPELQVQEVVAQRGATDILRQIAVAFARYYEAHPLAVEIMIQERAEFRDSVYPTHLMHRAETRAELDELIAAATAAGEFSQHNPQAVTDALADLLFGCVVNGCLAGSRTKLVQRVTQAMDIFLNGLVANPAPSGKPNQSPPSDTEFEV